MILPYSDRLARFAAWYVQLWGESLGKQGEGTTPVAALGPVDQHSQLQLYLDGAPQHFITIIRERCKGLGPRIAPDLAKAAGADYLAGHAAGDLVTAQQRAIPEALIAPSAVPAYASAPSAIAYASPLFIEPPISGSLGL